MNSVLDVLTNSYNPSHRIRFHYKKRINGIDRLHLFGFDVESNIAIPDCCCDFKYFRCRDDCSWSDPLSADTVSTDREYKASRNHNRGSQQFRIQWFGSMDSSDLVDRSARVVIVLESTDPREIDSTLVISISGPIVEPGLIRESAIKSWWDVDK